MAQLGGFKSPNGIRKPSLKTGMGASQKPGKIANFAAPTDTIKLAKGGKVKRKRK